MSINEFVHHFFNGINIEFGGGMGVKHCCLIDMLFFACYSCLDGLKLNINNGHVHCGALNGQGSNTARVYSATVYKTGHFDTRFLR